MELSINHQLDTVLSFPLNIGTRFTRDILFQKNLALSVATFAGYLP